jgi:UDP-glucose 4-epimerase
MRAMVTGVAGFIGSHLAERLVSDGWEVLGVDSFTETYDRALKERNIEGLRGKKGFEMVRGDLLGLELAELLGSVRVVFHLAAEAGVRSSWGSDFSKYVNRNVLATQRLLEACRDRPLEKFIYASSSSIYGEMQELKPLDELDCPMPHSPYGVTKLAAEHLCRTYWRNFGVPVVSLRYFTVYGPRQRPDMAFHRFLRSIYEGSEVVIFGDGDQSRDFTFVSDVVDATLLAATRGVNGGVYNIGGGSRATLTEVLRIMEEVTSYRPTVSRGPRGHGEVMHTWANTEKANAELGFRSKVSLSEGIARQWEWIRGLMKGK